MPLWDQTGVPGLLGLTHFHSSTISGSASLMSRRTFSSASPRQSPNSLILPSIFLEAASTPGADASFLGAAFLADLAAFLLILCSSGPAEARVATALAFKCHHSPLLSPVRARTTSGCVNHPARPLPSGGIETSWSWWPK